MDNNITENTNSFEQYLHDKASKNSIPISGTFELLPNCNMNCKMCYVRMEKIDVNRKGGLRPVEFWTDLAQQAMKKGLLFLLLTGGEPLLYPEFFELYKRLKNMGLHLTVNTNATLITEETARFFGKYLPRRLNISIYGKDDETYRTLCNNPKGFSQLKNAIILLKKYNVPMKLNYSMTPYNYEQFFEIREFAEQMQIPIEIGYYMMPPNRKEEKGEYNHHRLSPELAAKMAYEIKMYKLNEEERKEIAEQVLKDKNLLDLESKPKCGFWCRAGNCTFWINWQGRMVPCGMMNNPEYSLESQNFESAWEKMCKAVRKICLSSKCYYCEKRNVCMHCAASETSETGQFGKTPSYLCKLTDVYLELMEKEVMN